MNFQKSRMLIGIPFFVIINFFILKYTILLFREEFNEWYLLILAIFLGILHILPIIYESDKSTVLGRFVAKTMGVWTWILMFLAMDVVQLLKNLKVTVLF